MRPNIDVDALVDAISRCRIAVFVGRNDTGKSTLIKRISGAMDASVIDADIGQSDIGPPTVVALGERHGQRYGLVDGYFCGSTSPAGHFLQLVAGAARMAGKVKTHPVLVNTTGLATGEAGRALKTEKINALFPDVIVGIGDGLEYLDAFARAGAAVFHLPVSPAARRKSVAERTALRQRSFREHFRGAGVLTYAFDEFMVERSLLLNGYPPETGDDILRMDISDKEALAVTNGAISGVHALMDKLDIDKLYAYTPDDFAGVLIGLVDAHGKFAGLGIIEAMDFERDELRVYTAARAFSAIQVGSIKLSGKDFSYAGAFSGKKYARRHK